MVIVIPTIYDILVTAIVIAAVILVSWWIVKICDH